MGHGGTPLNSGTWCYCWTIEGQRYFPLMIIEMRFNLYDVSIESMAHLVLLYLVGLHELKCELNMPEHLYIPWWMAIYVTSDSK